ncbi:MAG: thiol:disulfide interchange protein [Solidesulfovibrio magneticus str. Maddingley MBC34]|uniref:Thiol:disulfide interchange protein n=1 Tax=Solidesulfovibrio magneticus str. Maddingley MBC34 TaxID=1206767 RepID=K6FGN4_9BACT|nr:MAG: thiol:disulfide interchange protein [Solidesulfovibrio magneticus str. Maddingley MBC34]
MLDQALAAIHGWMAGRDVLAGLGAFAWGLASVLLSPCHLASIPLIVGYVAGQGRLVEGRAAVGYAALFSLGLFGSIAAVGAACALLGRMLGDVGGWLPALVGVLLVAVSLDMLGLLPARRGGGGLARLRLRGLSGAFVLGLAYGVLSGACTFGFLAPVLGVVTLSGELGRGLALTALFALGHCLPILAAGSFAGATGGYLERAGRGRALLLMRRWAGGLVGAAGLYFLFSPLAGGS